MKEIRVLKRNEHELAQDVDDCVGILRQAGIWAHAGVLDFPTWRTIALVSMRQEALELLRSRGFLVC